MRLEDVIQRPLLTEKSTSLKDESQIVAFAVAVKTNKHQIRRAVEERFGVRVDEVRTMRVPGKLRRQGRTAGYQPEWKKAYVRLAEGEKPIEFFEGV